MGQQNRIAERVRAAIEDREPIRIHGGNTKAFYGNPSVGEPLDLSGHSGVVEYDPGELVISCRAGSRLCDISATLEEHGQYLPFEPPAFGREATIGGAIACGLSGPRRPWSGSLRDYLLGVTLVNGSGAVVRYGGQVMKNVAGYDISRLMAGSMGTLGVILEASFKVLPLPALELSLEFECDQGQAIRRINEWSGRPLPISGAFWWRKKLQLRLSGAASEIRQAANRLQADRVTEDPESWIELREHQNDFFSGPENLWRISLPPATGPVDLDGDCLVDWGGAQRWHRTPLPAGEIRECIGEAAGHATLFRGETDGERFHPLPPALRQLHSRIKQAFDPHGIFNPHRTGPDW
jgi:glycolate oxidase FAD binding subunit